MTKLNQLIAIEKGVKSTGMADLTATYHAVQKSMLLAGISKTYQARNEEDDERLVGEYNPVQISVEALLKQTGEKLARLFDVTLSKDATNQKASADIVVDGDVLLANVPVAYLLFLEKQLTSLNTLVGKLPVLDAAEAWTFNDNSNVWQTEPARTVRTKKVPRNHVKAEATDKHPAQVEVFYEDTPVGDWTTVKMSGAVPAKRRDEILGRIVTLAEAVKFAREKANGTEADEREAAVKIFGYLFA